jgi:hypothetical protein
MACGILSGCSTRQAVKESALNDTAPADNVMQQVDCPTKMVSYETQQLDYGEYPHTLRSLTDSNTNIEFMDLTLDQAIQMALMNSRILKDLGATILRNPDAIGTEYNKYLIQFDPRFGTAAALSAFDTQFKASVFEENDNRVYNNLFFGGGTSNYNGERRSIEMSLNKYAADGTSMTFSNISLFNRNNAPGNIYADVWETMLQAEVRRPLLKGGGVSYNRIAGPGGSPGVYNGIMIAKIRTDITDAQFQRQMNDYLSNVVNAYYDLYFSYRDADAKKRAMEQARKIWNIHQSRAPATEPAVNELLAREQYFRYQSEYENAVTGKLLQRTQNFNGTTGGSFRGIGGVLTSEMNLRLIIGFPYSDPRLIRTIDDPEEAPIEFNFPSLLMESIARRNELNEQRLKIKSKELELIASRNLLNPQLDVVGRYRVRGLGDSLIGSSDINTTGLRSAWGELGAFDHQEMGVGMEFSVPIGLRQQFAAVRHAEMMLVKERAILREQERQITHDLSLAIAEVDRAYSQTQINQSRYLAADSALKSLRELEKNNRNVDIDLILDAQKIQAETYSQYYLSRVEYAIAIKNVHYEKGSILEYANMSLSIPTPSPKQ